MWAAKKTLSQEAGHAAGAWGTGTEFPLPFLLPSDKLLNESEGSFS